MFKRCCIFTQEAVGSTLTKKLKTLFSDMVIHWDWNQRIGCSQEVILVQWAHPYFTEFIKNKAKQAVVILYKEEDEKNEVFWDVVRHYEILQVSAKEQQLGYVLEKLYWQYNALNRRSMENCIQPIRINLYSDNYYPIDEYQSELEKVSLLLKASGCVMVEYNVINQTYRLVSSAPRTNFAGLPREGACEDIKQRIDTQTMALIEKAVYKHLLEQTDYYRLEHQIKTLEGHLIWVQHIGRVFQKDCTGNPIAFLVVFTDVQHVYDTHREFLTRCAELEALHKVKDAIIANVSHAFRTPLNGLSGAVQLLSLTKLNEEQREYLEMLEHSNDRMGRLVNNLIQHIELQGKSELESNKEMVDFNRLICLAIDKVQKYYYNEKVTIHLKNNQEYRSVLLDREHFQILFEQILDNAVRYSLNNSVVVSMEKEINDHGEPFLIIEVYNQGLLSEAAREKLFKPLSTLDDPLKKDNQGLGMGLAIAKRIAEITGYHLELIVEQEMVVCKIKIGLEKPLKQAIVVYQEELSIKPKLKALVIDGDENSCSLLEKLLKTRNIEVQCAYTYSDGIQYHQAMGYDMIFLDPQASHLEGDGAVKELKLHSHNNVPIIAVHVHSTGEGREGLIEQGFDACIPKPLISSTVFGAIRSVFSYNI